MESVRIPRFLNTPEQILMMTLYEFVSFIVFFGIGIIFKAALFGVIGGGLAIGATRWAQNKGIIEQLNYYCYWYFPQSFLSLIRLDLKATPPSSYRRLTG